MWPLQHPHPKHRTSIWSGENIRQTQSRDSLVLFKVSRALETRKERNCHRLKETKETEQSKAMWDLELDAGRDKGR